MVRRDEPELADRLQVEEIRLETLNELSVSEGSIRRFEVPEPPERLCHLAGCTPNPNSAWVTQQARQLAWASTERSRPLRFLIRDRDSKFTRDFDTVFRSEGIEIIRRPVRAPKANAIAERFVRTIRSECLDWLLILNRGLWGA